MSEALLKLGYAYRLCLADEAAAVRKAEVKALLDAEIRAVNPNAPESIVLFASEIVAWVNTFPPLTAEMNGSSMTDFFHFKTWENQARAVTSTFVQTTERAVIFERVQGHLDWNTKRARHA